MNAAEATLVGLVRRGVQLWTAGSELRFKAPANVLTDEDRAALRAQKTALLALVGEHRIGAVSGAQQRLWYLAQLRPESTAYNMRLSLRVSGLFEPAALQEAFDRVVRRQAALRATFRAIGGMPLLCIASLSRAKLDYVNVARPSRAESERLAAATAEAAGSIPFALDRGPLFRAVLIALAPDEHWFVFVAHHLICDGWSLQVLFQELFAGYGVAGVPAPAGLPEPAVSYSDYAAWQSAPAEQARVAAGVAYWRERLAGSLPLLELPFAGTGGDGMGTTARPQCKLPTSMFFALRRYASDRGTTPFVVLLAVFKVLLRAYTGHDDIVIGTPVSNRSRRELESLVGLFLDTVAVRAHVPAEASFDTFVASLRETVVEALAHQDTPFDRVVEAVRPERHADRHPIFDFMFNLVDLPEPVRSPPGLNVELREEAPVDSKFRVTLYARTQDDGLLLYLGYRKDLYGQAEMELLLRQFAGLCGALLAAPQNPIGSFSLHDPAHDVQLPDPAAPLDAAEHVPVHRLFEAQVQRTPDRTAIEAGELSCTYVELDERARELAATLCDAGARPGMVVAIEGGRSIGFVVALIGVWRAGCIVMPIDPNQPAARRAQIFDDAAPAIWLKIASTELTAGEPNEATNTAGALPMTIAVGHDTGRLQCAGVVSGKAAGRIVTERDAAYVFFTSGSTGRPKGVLGSHRGLSHFVQWQGATFGFSIADRVAHVTTVTFDVVLREIFTTLIHGATLCVLPQSRDLGPARVVQWLEDRRITLLHTVPSIVNYWFSAAIPACRLPALRTVFFAGEPLPDKLIQRWRETFTSSVRIVNFYGPTETTLAKCWFDVPTPAVPGVQPIGRPLPQTQALVLNAACRLCGPGEVGEIAIRTPFRSHGYINQAEETARRFVPNPYGRDQGDRLYLTGDLGRFRVDGGLEILGRRDDQLKLNGVRIEPAEIEAALLRVAPSIRAAKVVAAPFAGGERRLAAYVVTSDVSAFPVAAVRQSLRAVLPSHLVPTTIMPLREFPRNANGKIDVNALPPPMTAAAPRVGAKASSSLELAIATVWQEVLGTTEVGLDDNYFDLGGHSLLMIKVHHRLQSVLPPGTKLTMLDLFKFPTVRTLAAHLAGASGAAPRTAALSAAHRRAALRLNRRPVAEMAVPVDS